MKTRLLSGTILSLVAITILSYFSFDINRFLPLRLQWLHATSIVILLCVLFWLLTKAFYEIITKQTFKTYVVSGPLALITIVIFISFLYQAGSIRTTTGIANFLRTNESELKQVVGNNNGEVTAHILTDLNIRLIKGSADSYHFELYSFMGYGYRILYDKAVQIRMPKSPGGSPTFKWHRIKQNWFYYSYLD